MNKIKIITGGILLVLSTLSCTDLKEDVYSSVSQEKFFTNERNLLMNAGRAYTKLQSYPEEMTIWSLTELASDEMVAPGRDDGFVMDGGRWAQIQRHVINPNNKILRLAWEYVYAGISASNEVLYETESSPNNFDGKDKIVAEIKILRAFFYYLAMDNWGTIPFSIDFTDKSLPVPKDRIFMSNFLIKEINDNVEKLEKLPTTANYGRATQSMAYTLLSKIYLNSQEWTGVAKWQETIDACNKVIGTGAYRIEDNFFTNFKAKNEISTENIFVIPLHSLFAKDNLYWYALTLNDASRATFNFKGAMWDEFVLEPGFLDKYSAKDVRKKSFLFGQQYDKSGNPIFIGTEPFVYDPNIQIPNMRKKWEGARCCKYEYQEGLQYNVTDMENDFVIFRYADVIYTKFEALYRQGKAGEMIGDPSLTKIRTRAGLAPYTLSEVTNAELLDELGREFAWEGKRRQDQIRFGVWGNAWWDKPVSPASAKLFPIPITVLNSNPNLVQNPGY